MTTSTDSDPTPAVKRPGGRSARVRDAVYDAVGELLDSSPRDAMSIPQIAEMAGVNPTTVYRRWGSMDVLLEEVAVAFLAEGASLPDTGDLRTDLQKWAGQMAVDLATPRRRTYLRAMVWAREDVVTECPRWEIRRGQVTEIVERARARGERTPDVEQILDHVVAPMYHHSAFGLPVGEAMGRRMVDDVLLMTRC